MDILNVNDYLMVDITGLMPTVKESTLKGRGLNPLYKQFEHGVKLLKETSEFTSLLLMDNTDTLLVQLMFTECTDGFLGVWYITTLSDIIQGEAPTDVIKLLDVKAANKSSGSNINFYVLEDTPGYQKNTIKIHNTYFRGISTNLSHYKLDFRDDYTFYDPDNMFELKYLQLNISSLSVLSYNFSNFHSLTCSLRCMGNLDTVTLRLSSSLTTYFVSKLSSTSGTELECFEDDIRFIVHNLGELNKSSCHSTIHIPTLNLTILTHNDLKAIISMLLTFSWNSRLTFGEDSFKQAHKLAGSDSTKEIRERIFEIFAYSSLTTTVAVLDRMIEEEKCVLNRKYGIWETGV